MDCKYPRLVVFSKAGTWSMRSSLGLYLSTQFNQEDSYSSSKSSFYGEIAL
uniref:Uncharacterized protein n=1 Tax=Anguilla anguilla TaxID=7936 RepID=A0A0E9P641_ANGAN